MILLQIDENLLPLVSQSQLEQAASAVLVNQSQSEGVDLTIVITGDETLHKLNKQFMDVDAPTDVLSFPSGEPDPETGRIYLGDILISYPRAESQAEQGGHATPDELQLLTVHGVLHLLGHDHANDDQKSKMWAAQAEILKTIGCPIPRLNYPIHF
ncbi:MAG: rRNA maturation RNase YbeY [Anaerolineae bacterium]|nr:rRNA maturation RNase YbeY [Anaerolineae bacterium]